MGPAKADPSTATSIRLNLILVPSAQAELSQLSTYVAHLRSSTSAGYPKRTGKAKFVTSVPVRTP